MLEIARQPDAEIVRQKICNAPSAWALFLDIDGTLLDIAPTPEGVVVPPGLVETLTVVSRQLHGAVGVLTGRTINSADYVLAPLQPVISGVHGSEWRTLAGGPIIINGRAMAPNLLRAVQQIANSTPGARLEYKTRGLALHYRETVENGERLSRELHALLRSCPNQYRVIHGRKVVELVPTSASKAVALQMICQLPQFRGRRPVMIGDDVGDVAALQAAQQLGGYGLSVAGGHFTGHSAGFASPHDVRAWITTLRNTIE